MFNICVNAILTIYSKVILFQLHKCQYALITSVLGRFGKHIIVGTHREIILRENWLKQFHHWPNLSVHSYIQLSWCHPTVLYILANVSGGLAIWPFWQMAEGLDHFLGRSDQIFKKYIVFTGRWHI